MESKRSPRYEIMRRYRLTAKGKATRNACTKRYLQSPKGKAAHNKRNRRLYHMPSGQIRHKKVVRNGKWKRWAVGILKLNMGGCVDCGYSANAFALDFDHKPEFHKHNEVAQLAACSWRTILEEIAKCDLVCANCHRIRTMSRNPLCQNQFK